MCQHVFLLLVTFYPFNLLFAVADVWDIESIYTELERFCRMYENRRASNGNQQIRSIHY